MLHEMGDQLSVRDRLLALRSLDVFANLSVSSLNRLAETVQMRTFKEGDVLLVEGRPPPCVHILLQGRVRVERSGRLVAVVERGRGVGVLSILGRDEQGISAVALEQTTSFEISSTAFLAAYEHDFLLVRNALKLSAMSIINSRQGLPADPNNPPHVDLGVFREEPRTVVERMIEIRSGPLFQNCNIDAVIELARRGREMRLRAGETLWDLGSDPSYTVRADYGQIRCVNASGQSVDVGFDFTLGVMDSFAGQPRAYSATAVTDLVLFRIERDIMLAVLEGHFRLAMDIVAVLTEPLLAGN